METKLVIFDMDGVVIDSENLYYTALVEQAQAMGVPGITREYYRQFIGGGNERMVKIIARDYHSDQLAHDLVWGSIDRVGDLVDQGHLELKPGFLTLTDYLMEHNIPFVLGSSSELSNVKRMLGKLGVYERFDAFITADDVQQAKPAPDIFLKAWEIGGQPDRQQTLIIEDSVNGIKAANAAQIPVIMVPDVLPPTPATQKATVAVLDDLVAVRDFIAN